MAGGLHINILATVAHSEFRRRFTTSPNTPCRFGRHSVNSAVFTLPQIKCKSTAELSSTMSGGTVVVVVTMETSSSPDKVPVDWVDLAFGCSRARCT